MSVESDAAIYGQDRTTNLDISQLTKNYAAAYYARRVCQLFCFLLVFIFFVSAFNFAADLFIWVIGASAYAISQGSQAWPSPVTFDAFADVLSLWDITCVALAAVTFAVFAQLQRAWWVLGLAAMGLTINLATAYFGTLDYDYQWVDDTGADMSAARSLVPILYMSGLVVLHIYFAWLAFSGQRAVHRLSDVERMRLREFDGADTARKWVDTIKSLFNIPQAHLYAKRHIWTGFLMAVAGVANFTNFWRAAIVFIFVCLIPVVATYLFPNIGVVVRALVEGRNLGQVAIDLTIVAIFLAFYLTVIMVIPYGVGVLSRACVRQAERQMRTSLEEIQHLDDRAPILFLRSFINDTVPLPEGRLTPAKWMLDGAGALSSLDMMILDEGTRTGPTVALGNPDDPAPPYGVARGYFDHDSWKDAVMGLCERSAAIVLVLDQTEGVEWEIGHIAARRYTGKTLFLLAPEDVGQERGTLLLGTALARATGRNVPAMIALVATQKNAPAFGLALVDGEPQPLCSPALRQYDYLVALRRFMRMLPDQSSKPQLEQSIPISEGSATPIYKVNGASDET